MGEFVCVEKVHKKRLNETCGMVFKTKEELEEHKRKVHRR